MVMTRGPLVVMACNSGRPFASRILPHLNNYLVRDKRDSLVLAGSRETHFANSEIKTAIVDSIRGSDLYIVQDVENATDGLSVDQRLRALKTAIDAARRSDAHYITAVLPVFPYARQDKQIGREGVTAALVAQEIEDTGAERVITLDIHNTAIAGFFRKAKFENLHGSKNITDYVRNSLSLERLVVTAPDVGGIPRASKYAEMLGVPLAMVYKERDYSKPSTIGRCVVLGDVRDKDVLIVDDMIATGGSMDEGSRRVKDAGARSVHLACSLPLFNHPALDRIRTLHQEGIIEQVIGTDAVFHGDDFKSKNSWFAEVSVARYFAKVIYNINTYASLSQLLRSNGDD